MKVVSLILALIFGIPIGIVFLGYGVALNLSEMFVQAPIAALQEESATTQVLIYFIGVLFSVGSIIIGFLSAAVFKFWKKSLIDFQEKIDQKLDEIKENTVILRNRNGSK